MDKLKKSFETAIDKASVAIGISEPKPKTAWDEFDEMTTMSRTTRLVGFCSCFVLGWILSFASVFKFSALIQGEPKGFAIMFAVGNLISIAGTCFLSGPWSHIKSMFDQKRWIATTIYLVSIIATIVVAVKVPKIGLVILCMVIELCAMIWYTASYIPFGRDMIKNCLFGCCKQ